MSKALDKPITLHVLKALAEALPVKLATVKAAILGLPERGKTYAAGVIAEELLEAGIQVIVLDSVGTWYGLRLGANGKSKGYDIHIFGGEHGDLPLVPTAGAVLAETLVRTRKSAIIDTTGFATEAEQRRFIGDFAEAFYRLKMRNKSRVTLILEEADDWIPEQPETTELRMLGAFQRIARKGRNFGIGLLTVSQRPQGIRKKVLNLSEVLFIFGISGKHERDAIKEWTKSNSISDEDRDKALGMLPDLGTGECLVWWPRFKIFKVCKIRKKRTFDASATPDGDGETATLAVKPLDTAELAKAMAATVEEAKANDPKSLRARIAELEAEMAKRGTVVGKTTTITKTVPVLGKREAKALERIEANVRKLTEAVVDLQQPIAGVARDFETVRRTVAAAIEAPTMPVGVLAPSVALGDALATAVRHESGRVEPAPADLKARIMERLRFFYPVPLTREQLAYVCDISRTTKSFITAVAELTAEGQMSQTGGRMACTPGTPGAANFVRPGEWVNYLTPPARAEVILGFFAKKADRLEREALRHVVQAGPGVGVRREDLAMACNISRTTKSFISAVSALTRCRFLVASRGLIHVGSIIAEGRQ